MCIHKSSPGHVLLWQAFEVSVFEGFIYCADVFVYTSSHLRGEGVKGQATRSRAFKMAISVAVCAKKSFFGNAGVQKSADGL